MRLGTHYHTGIGIGIGIGIGYLLSVRKAMHNVHHA